MLRIAISFPTGKPSVWWYTIHMLEIYWSTVYTVAQELRIFPPKLKTRVNTSTQGARGTWLKVATQSLNFICMLVKKNEPRVEAQEDIWYLMLILSHCVFQGTLSVYSGWKSIVLNQCSWVFEVVFAFLKKSHLFFIPCHSPSLLLNTMSLNLKALIEANIVARMKFRH